MKHSLTACLLIMSATLFAQETKIERMLNILPAGIYEGNDCKLSVEAHDNYISYNIFNSRGAFQWNAQFVEGGSSDRVSSSSFGRTSFTLKFTRYPDDQYSGKDVVTVEFAHKKLTVKTRDYGPVGIGFNTRRASCKIN